MKRLLSKDATTGKEIYMNQGSDGSTVIETTQNFDTLLKLNKQMNNDYNKGSMIGNTQRHMQHVAEIPNVVYHHLLEKFGKPSENPKAWKAWLNSNENRAFRTGGGNI
jgi:hypothetical protein